MPDLQALSGEDRVSKVAAVIHLEKQGQFFREFDVDAEGVVVGVRPQMEWFWKGAQLIGFAALKVGDVLRYQSRRTYGSDRVEMVEREFLFRGAPLRVQAITRSAG